LAQSGLTGFTLTLPSPSVREREFFSIPSLFLMSLAPGGGEGRVRGRLTFPPPVPR
jgi:hypothetical protein